MNFKDTLLSIMCTQEVLIKLLIRKDIIQEDGLVEEIKKISKRTSH